MVSVFVLVNEKKKRKKLCKLKIKMVAGRKTHFHFCAKMIVLETVGGLQKIVKLPSLLHLPNFMLQNVNLIAHCHVSVCICYASLKLYTIT